MTTTVFIAALSLGKLMFMGVFAALIVGLTLGRPSADEVKQGERGKFQAARFWAILIAAIQLAIYFILG